MELEKIRLPFKLAKSVLALGSHTKNRVCFAKNNFAYLSRIHSDLSNPGDFACFEKTVKYFLKKNPKIIAYDLHPEYQSTKYALTLAAGRYLSPVQHHHAHIASCMLENGLKNQEVIGVAFDGTGWGPDNTLWGAEFFSPCDYGNFIRGAHLKEIPLLGGERAILEPWRLALAWLYPLYQDKILNLKINFVRGLKESKWRVIKQMYLSGFNSPLASSMGRLFDAAASLILAKHRVASEAALAQELERLAGGYASKGEVRIKGYHFRIAREAKGYIIDPSLAFREIIPDLQNRRQTKEMACRFHLTVAQMLEKTALKLRKDTGINRVVLSGGVFQNNLLLRLSLDLLYKDGFGVFTHQSSSCNDSGISLGQAVIASFARSSGRLGAVT